MIDLIEREAAIAAVTKGIMNNITMRELKDNPLIAIAEGVAVELLAIPSANRTGKWMEDKRAEEEHQLIYHKVWTCEDCGAQECRPEPTNYCPNCGRFMKGGK